MRKSVTGFVCGLIGSLFCLNWGFIMGFFANIAGCVKTGEAGNNEALIIYFLGWLCFIGAIFGIVGAANCFKKARVGAIWLTIATVMCSPLLIYIFVNIQSLFEGFATNFILTNVVIFLLPAILLAVATVFAWLGKEIKKDAKLANLSYQAGDKNNSGVDDSALEKELLKLRATLDKGIITKEEYDLARKKIIEKYM